ncbi:hypothetical protein EXN66_Car005590 [Channa argus]|uniref:Uncharacterized protein n=1 Tax=Channa argus TaxID=215402 RepID=A0A6G1PIV3_CHAAH|nr:hypothetical protein EXN66_Car005590 [Channa argus]
MGRKMRSYNMMFDDRYFLRMMYKVAQEMTIMCNTMVQSVVLDLLPVLTTFL